MNEHILHHAFVHYITDENGIVKTGVSESTETKLGQRGVVSMATAAKEPENTYKATLNRATYEKNKDPCFRDNPIQHILFHCDISTNVHKRAISPHAISRCILHPTFI